MKFTLALLFLGLIVFAAAFPKGEEKQRTDEEDQNEALADEKEIQEGKQTNEADLLDEESPKENAEADGKEIDVQRRSMRTFIRCEGHSGVLSCPTGQRIVVHHANYGRTTGGHVCWSLFVGATNCHSAYSSRVIRGACDGHQSCRLSANNSVFGDPCPWTYKYIEVKYNCQAGQ